jgi:L-asparaginase / beta-aspartyl-peptidase
LSGDAGSFKGQQNKMNRCILLIVLTLLPQCSLGHDVATNAKYAIVIHGGAGRISTDADHRTQRQKVLAHALSHGETLLKEGKSSLQVVEEVVRILEDAPEFNAGRGAVLNAAEQHELDASIMDGKTRACGGVAGVKTVRHPITLARHVMTDTRHVLLATDGAETFADQLGPENIQRVPNSWFTTDKARKNLREAQAVVPMPTEFCIGTVGCVALDLDGNIAAATSTGGLTNKKFGRIGDSPIIGAGTFADNRTCGVSCTGVGEDFIRNSIAFNVSAQMEYAGSSLNDSVQNLLNDKERRISGGIIAVSAAGEITMQFNTGGMSRAAADSTGRHEVHVAE